jgi:hypothetical protein
MLVVVLLLGVALSVTVASGSFSGRPALRLVDRAPVVVRGSGFDAGEQVSVALLAGTRSVRRAPASQAGAFVVRFGVSLGRCARYSVQAFGSAGSRARLVSRVALACVSRIPDQPKPTDSGHD